jgi:hypothetical protein
VEEWKNNPAGMLEVYQRQPYKMGHSIADLVDNSYDAGAKRVEVDIDRDPDTDEMFIRVFDDGKGIPENKWKDAMMLGLQRTRKKSDLGVYGVGLKLSSLSQANEVTVASVHKGKFGQRRISAGHIKETGRNELLLTDTGSAAFNDSRGRMIEEEWSTMVLLEDIHTERYFATLDMERNAALEKEVNRIRCHLGLTFERAIRSKLLGGTVLKFQGREVAPIDPFMRWEEHARFGTIVEPTFTVNANIEGKKIPVRVTPAIIPHRKQRRDQKRCAGVEKGYLRANDMQGLYIYRNDRLIQYGGWNGMYGDMLEPHKTLGKVSVDIPPGYEAEFGLSPTKTDIRLPMEFAKQLLDRLSEPKQWGQIKKGSKSKLTFREAFEHRYKTEGKPAKLKESKKPGKPAKDDTKESASRFDPSKTTRKKPVKPKPVVRDISKDGPDTVVVIDNDAEGSSELMREIRRWKI